MNVYDRLPQEMKDNWKFCLYRMGRPNSKCKRSKIPYNPLTGGKAQSNNPATFTDFHTAVAALTGYDGLGVGAFGNTVCIDIDDCVVSGNPNDFASTVISIMNSPAELSPSGTGLHIYCAASRFVYDKAKYYISNHEIGLEVYVAGATNKFVTLTGNIINDAEFGERGEQLQKLLDMYMLRTSASTKANLPAIPARAYLTDESVIHKASVAKNGEAFQKLWNGDISGYGSQSEADLALASILAFWCGMDIAQMDRLFRKSGLMRPKWDRPQNGTAYGQITLQKAVQDTTETYTPMGVSMDKSAIDPLYDWHPLDNPRYGWSDIGNGYLFADLYKSAARFVPERKMWYVFDGVVWKPDVGSLKTMELCKRLADQLMMYALSIPDERSRSAYIDFVRRWQNRRHRETVLKDATGVHPIPMSCFDKESAVFNCPNGTLNLITGSFNKHNPDDMLSKVSDVYYDPGSRCERWERFIREVMQNDAEKARFFQKALGYALTGSTHYEVLFVLYGSTTRNGKGTAMETFLRIMGDYGKAARPETIGMKINNSSNNPTEDVARLAGARFVNISEPDKRLTLSTATVKTLTGNDTINARYLHEYSFDFRPQFKLFINTNFLPQINDTTIFSSGRVRVIPFERHFEGHEQDEHLKDTLIKPENLSGILNWCIEGFRMLKKEGFGMPESVRIATDSYRHISDRIGLFIEDSLIQDARGEVRTAEVYAVYRQWCLENGYKTESAKNFNTALGTTMDIERRRPRIGGGPTTLITGYKLLSGYDKITPL